MSDLGNGKLEGLEVVPDQVVRDAIFQGAFGADMFAMGLMVTHARWVKGLPVPRIMGRDFSQCIARRLTKDEIERLGLDAGRHLARGYFQDQVAKLGDARAQRIAESWVRASKLHIGF